ncbi:MAG: 50S ribosomal protein L15e [Candidatus Aenigmarchaeota archaeon ex4484_52]|nr:MAG: 50S ribosomal protein L15e [Candidatus Aenigmarchaeota archaeon ex4484_52]
MSALKYIKKLWFSPKKNLGIVWKQKLIDLRKKPIVCKIEKPTRIDRARILGYKAKQGYVIVQSRVGRGGMTRPKSSVRMGRKPKKYGFVHFTPSKSRQLMAEQRANRKYPNLEVLNSYYLAEDGKHKWYEIIMVDPCHPQIMRDSKINWICSRVHTRRVYRDLTSAGKKMRGLRK